MGDFNEMLHNSEKDSTRLVEPIRMSLFRNFLDTNELMDVSLKVNRFTSGWFNHKSEN